jgi:tetratricopeptide (TPR) repeat protein
MKRLLRLVVAVLAVSAAHGPIAHAQAPAAGAQHKRPTQKALDAARAHFKTAETAKARGEYKTAAVEYLAAYELFADPEFFFDTAEVYQLAGEDQDSLTYYEKYLELDPNGRGVASARASADQLRHAIAARQDAAKRALDEEARRKAEEDSRRAVDEAARLNAAQTQPPGSSGRNLRLAGIAVGGTGAAALAVGVFFGLNAQSISDELSKASAYDASRDNEGKVATRNMIIFTGLGGAAAIIGGVLYYVGHRAGRPPNTDSTVTFAPVVAPSQITLVAQCRF